jgi:hypothetical protein
LNRRTHKVSVSQIDSQTELSRGEDFARGEHILECGLALGLDDLVEVVGREVLNVVGEVLRVSERAVDGLNNEWGRTVVLESDQKFGDFSSWQISAFRADEEHLSLGERRGTQFLIITCRHFIRFRLNKIQTYINHIILEILLNSPNFLPLQRFERRLLHSLLRLHHPRPHPLQF